MEDIRAEIDEVDAQMAQLFEKRVRLSKEAAKVKAAAGLPAVDPEREKEIIEKNLKLVSPEIREKYKEFQEGVLEISKK